MKILFFSFLITAFINRSFTHTYIAETNNAKKIKQIPANICNGSSLRLSINEFVIHCIKIAKPGNIMEFMTAKKRVILATIGF